MIDNIFSFFKNFDWDDVAKKFNDFFGTDFEFNFQELYSNFSDFIFYISQNEKIIITFITALSLFIFCFVILRKAIKSGDFFGFFLFYISKPIFWFIIGPWSYSSLLTHDKHTSSLGAVFFMIWFCILYLGFQGFVVFGIPMGIICQLRYNNRHKEVF